MRRHVAVLSIALLTLPMLGSPAAWGAARQQSEQPAAEPTAQPSADGQAAAPARQDKQAQATQKPGNVKQWMETHKRSKKGAFLGALAGAAAGAWVAARSGKNVLGGAAAGAVVGGVAGFLIGRNRDQIFAGRDQAVELAHYDPSQGYLMRVEEISFAPANAKPGEKAILSVRYLVIGPDPKEKITVNCFRGIKYQDDYILGDGPRSFVVPHGGGIVTTTLEITIPKEAPAGTYAVEAMFEDPGGRFQQSGSSPLYIAT